MINAVNAYERIKTEINKIKGLTDTDKILIKATIMNCLMDEMSWQTDQDFNERRRALAIKTELTELV